MSWTFNARHESLGLPPGRMAEIHLLHLPQGRTSQGLLGVEGPGNDDGKVEQVVLIDLGNRHAQPQSSRLSSPVVDPGTLIIGCSEAQVAQGGVVSLLSPPDDLLPAQMATLVLDRLASEAANGSVLPLMVHEGRRLSERMIASLVGDHFAVLRRGQAVPRRRARAYAYPYCPDFQHEILLICDGGPLPS